MQMPTLRTTVDGDGIMTVWFDAPGKSVNTITWQMLQDLREVVSAVERDKPRGVIFASTKPDCFIAGGDLFDIRKLATGDPEMTTKFLSDGQALWNRIEKLPCPTAVAINGDCLGGGFELALACTWRVAADDGSINIGLPEVKIGILPGWGGTTRLPRLIGLPKSLPLLLTGKALPPKKARKAGLIDETVRPEALLAAARRLVLSGRKKPKKLPLIDRLASGMGRNVVLSKATKKTLEQTHGNYPAAMQILHIVKAGYDRGFDAGLEAERKALRELMDTPACHNLMRLFFLKQGAKKSLAAQLNGARGIDVKHAAVIGGGTMGAGIAHSLVRAGVRVRLVEVNEKAAAAALGRVRKMLDDDVYSGKLSVLEAKHAFNRVSPTTDWTGLGMADVVVEAVAESMDVKREVFAKLDKLCRPDAVLASNTSSLCISEMALATQRPNRVVGLHFFNPVPKMPLVEVVRADKSDDASLATAVGVASKIGKIPVLVKDAPGFLVNRVLIPYLAEALVMAGEGVSIGTIDETMKKWGMPMGPFELLDEIGLDIAAHVLQSLGAHMDPPLAASPSVGAALKRGWLGKKSGKGFYVYDGKKKSAKPALNHEMAALIAAGKPAMTVPDEQIHWRLVLPMVNEAAKLLDEGVADSADTVDLATVLGLGFAPFRGGLARFADSVGSDKVLAHLEELAARHGPRFAPAAALKPIAADKKPMTEIHARDGVPARAGWREPAMTTQGQ
jgi:3-hydroxyacyl-CoA dehydrogenase/enoyl-CoA hydratase/3-hydroxybutyryl-CoA epimerase